MPALLAAAALSEPLEKGIIYVQPSYHYSNTLSLNIDVSNTSYLHGPARGGLSLDRVTCAVS
jgi:hypothetical protein